MEIKTEKVHIEYMYIIGTDYPELLKHARYFEKNEGYAIQTVEHDLEYRDGFRITLKRTVEQ